MDKGIDAGLKLDRLWCLTEGKMEQTKEPTLLAVCDVLEGAGVAYAVIGGVALQIHASNPRTTLDIDLAVLACPEIPGERLTAAGFTLHGRFPHSENWRGPDGTPVQFTDDPALSGAIGRAGVIERRGVRLRIIQQPDLLREKLRSGTDPARRRSKRLQDLADAQALLEADPSLAAALSPEQRAVLDRLPG